MRLTLLAPLALLVWFSSCNGKGNNPPPIPNNKALKWSKTFGGNDYEYATALHQTSSNEYIVAGASRSSGGDIGGTRVGFDVWLAKVDNNGNKIWSNTFGTTDDEYANGVVAAADGGFVVVGYKFVNNQNFAFAIKTDAGGNKVWQKDFAGSNDSKPQAILSSPDGSFIIAGYTTEGAGGKNAWVTKIDIHGNIVWNKTFGGSDEDYAYALTRGSDGGYVLAGATKSTSGDIAGSKGGFDGWIMKIDDGGSKMWSKTYGGSRNDHQRSIAKTSDGGYILAGYSNSSDGDITHHRGGDDEWVLKVDVSGNKQWSTTFGGTNDEYATGVVTTTDGGYMIAGHTNSVNGDAPRIYADWGAWLIKTDASGKLTVTSTYGDTQEDITNTIINTSDGGYLIGGYTDVATRGYDAWLVKVDAL
jgi:hypothetical protein